MPGRPGDEPDVEVRAFTERADGVVEDPATGSLNAGPGQWLIADGHPPASYAAAQGTPLRRRGRVRVETDGIDVWVAAATVTHVAGELRR